VGCWRPERPPRTQRKPLDAFSAQAASFSRAPLTKLLRNPEFSGGGSF
jgi:hypothetical protein